MQNKKTGLFVPAMCNLIGVIMVLAVIATTLPLVIPRTMGYEIFNVESGSMDPEIPLGSVVYVHETDPQDIRPGEIITFVKETTIITHRVRENRVVEGEFITKGDANPQNDIESVPYGTLIGRVEYHLPILGTLMVLYTSDIGKVYVILFGACGVMFNILASRMRIQRRRRLREQAKLEAARAKQQAEEARANGIEPPVVVKKKHRVRKVLMALLLIIFIGAGVGAGTVIWQYHVNNELYSEAAGQYTIQSRTDVSNSAGALRLLANYKKDPTGQTLETDDGSEATKEEPGTDQPDAIDAMNEIATNEIDENPDELNVAREAEVVPAYSYWNDAYYTEDGQYVESGWYTQEGSYLGQEVILEDGQTVPSYSYWSDAYYRDDGQYVEQGWYTYEGQYLGADAYAVDASADEDGISQQEGRGNSIPAGSYWSGGYYLDDGSYIEEGWYSPEGQYVGGEQDLPRGSYWGGGYYYDDGSYVEEGWYSPEGQYLGDGSTRVIRKGSAGAEAAADLSPSKIIEEKLYYHRNRILAPIVVDFDRLCDFNEDIVGWIYCPDTVINYPVLKGEDDNTYLRHTYDGNYNIAGSIFVEAENNKPFTDSNTIVYGHHMNDGSMFAVLDNWAEQEYYEEHPIMWMLTPERDYMVVLIAGYVTSAYSDTYTIYPEPSQEFQQYLQEAIAKSDFVSNVELSEDGHYVLLSTCAYVFDYARHVLHGLLIPVDSIGGRPVNR